MTTSLIIVCIIALIVIIFAIRGIRVIRQSETSVIERLGKYHKTLPSGINIVWPIIDRPREFHTRYAYTDINGSQYVKSKTSSRIDLREQVYDFPKQSVITKDNVQTEINALLYFQIVDPVKAVYEIDNHPNAIEKLTQTTLRNVIGELELDETLTSRDTINAKLRAVLDDATNKWGVKVNRVELQDIIPPASVKAAMEQQMQAERQKRAAILTAEGDKQTAILTSEGEKASQINQAEAKKQAMILQAEAEKQAAILKAEGEADAKVLQAEAEARSIGKIADAVAQTKTDPASFVLAEKYIAAIQQMASGDRSKTVFLPFEASNLLGSIGGIKEIFEKK